MRYRRYRYRRGRTKWILLLCLAMLFIIILAADSALRPIVRQFAGSQAEIVANRVINEAVNDVLTEQNVRYSDLIRLNTGADNQITSVETDTPRVTMIQTSMIGAIQNRISGQDALQVRVPIGTITGNQFLLGRGPSVTIRLEMSPAVHSEIRSEFSDAGINQTRHQIVLYVTAKIFLVMPLYRTTIDYSNNFIIAETVIVGSVPDTFANFKMGAALTTENQS